MAEKEIDKTIKSITGKLTAQLKQSLTELKKVDTYLTEISRLNSKLSKTELKQLGNDSFDIAGKYGKSAADYLSNVKEMYSAGYKNAESMAELSMAIQTAGNLTADLANRYIFAADKAYNLGGTVEQLTQILNGSNSITNHNSISMTELANGMMVVGSAAADAGLSIQETIAVLGTMISASKQSGAEAAEAFKTILSNIQQISDEKLRTPMEVLKELSAQYKAFGKNTNLLGSVGEGTDSKALEALLSNWSMYETMLQQYEAGTGSMALEAEKVADSWEGSLNRLSNTWSDTVGNFVNSDAVVGVVNSLNGVLEVVTRVTDAIGPLASVGLGAGLFAGIKNVGINMLVAY